MLTFGIREPSANTTWLVWDNFKLTYRGNTGTAISEIENSKSAADNQYYDLQGRRLNAMPQKGVYILNGKKYVR